jgi:hypothetical protein
MHCTLCKTRLYKISAAERTKEKVEKEKLEQEEIQRRILEYKEQAKASLKLDESARVVKPPRLLPTQAQDARTPGASSSGGVSMEQIQAMISPIIAQQSQFMEHQAMAQQQATGAMMQMMQQIQFVLAHSGAPAAVPLTPQAANTPEWHQMSDGDQAETDWERPER